MKRIEFLLLLCLLLSPLSVIAQIDELGNRLLLASPFNVQADAELSAYMTSKAELAIDEHCVSCHGPELEGRSGVPNLVDYDWLWGVTGLEASSIEPTLAIMQTILHGVRDTQCPEESKSYGACPDTRFSQMPSFEEIAYTEQQMSDLTDYVLSKSGTEANAEAVARGELLWPVCIECHGEAGYGYKPYGGPNLRDGIWLFGGNREQIYDVIAKGRTEYCPAWAVTLDAVTIKALALYIYNKANGY